MRVAPDVQRRGFGRRVLEHLEIRATELGYTHLHLDTTAQQLAAQALYRSHGYRETAREQRGRFELIFFEKSLTRGGESKALTSVRCSTALSPVNPNAALVPVLSAA